VPWGALGLAIRGPRECRWDLRSVVAWPKGDYPNIPETATPPTMIRNCLAGITRTFNALDRRIVSLYGTCPLLPLPLTRISKARASTGPTRLRFRDAPLESVTAARYHPCKAIRTRKQR